jgi:hypothetical protein
VPRKTRSKAAAGKAAPAGAEFIAKAHPAVQPHLASTTDIPGFLQTVGQLLPEHRLVLIEQALVLLESTYVHLPLKRAMYAIDPIQRLRLLKYELEQTPPDQRPYQSLDVSDGTTTLEITSHMMALVELQGYKDGRLIAAKRIVV